MPTSPSLTRRVLTIAMLGAFAAPVHAQSPTLTLSKTVVAPTETVSATIRGTAGQSVALVGSTVGSGLSYAGVSLAVGADVTILFAGVLDGTGQVIVPLRPPFAGTTLDRYYLQAVTSPSPAFVPLAASAGVILRNADLVGGLAGAPGTVDLQVLSGTAQASIAAGGGNVEFVGPTATVTTTATQKVVGTIATTFFASGGSADVRYGICYRASPAGAIAYFAPVATRQRFQALLTNMTFTATGGGTPGAGTWDVGMCAGSANATSITAGMPVNGWVMVVNP